MKKLTEIKKRLQTFTIEGLDGRLSKRFSNLDNKPINECECGCGCMTCADECKPYCPSEPQIVWYYSEKDVVNKLERDVKIQDLINMNSQFTKSKFHYIPDHNEGIEILYFNDTFNNQNNASTNTGVSNDELKVSTSKQDGYNGFYVNDDLHQYLQDLCNTYELQWPVILRKNDGSWQAFFVKYGGSNGKTGSIKDSLNEIADILDDLDSTDEATWSQVLDISIDNVDDTYAFLITIDIDIDCFPYNPKISEK